MTMNQDLSATSVLPPKLMFIDEAGCLLGNKDDQLKEDLREIEGVPNATYLVKDGQVFVFDKLVLKVKEHSKLNPDVPLADLARNLVPFATVSAKEAVDQWGIIPAPYEMVENPAGGFSVRHRPFNARLPGVFQTKNDVQDAFARLLIGGIEAGNGDFTYKSQPMSLCAPLDLARLPPRPAIHREVGPAKDVYAVLANVGYEAGFAPLSEELFAHVKSLEESWKEDSARAVRYAQNRAAELWQQTGVLRLETLNGADDEVPDHSEQDFAELRLLYPELSMLSDGSLFAWFDYYQMESCYINGWTPSRDDDFLFYLLGKVAGREYERDSVKEIGEWAAYALLRGDSFDAALDFSRAAALYDSAIDKLAWRVADAIRYLVEDKKAIELHGRPIRTFADMFRESRKCNTAIQPTVVSQELSDLLRMTKAADGDSLHTLILGQNDQGAQALNPMSISGTSDCLSLIAKIADVELTPDRQEAGMLIMQSLPLGATFRDFLDAAAEKNAQRIGLSPEMLGALAPMLSGLERFLEPENYGQLFRPGQ